MVCSVPQPHRRLPAPRAKRPGFLVEGRRKALKSSVKEVEDAFIFSLPAPAWMGDGVRGRAQACCRWPHESWAMEAHQERSGAGPASPVSSA